MRSTAAARYVRVQHDCDGAIRFPVWNREDAESTPPAVRS